MDGEKSKMQSRQSRIEDPLWYKDAIIYEARMRSFYDTNHDGIGDFPGLTQKLEYLQDLGINTLWILPFYPSPLKDDGYDISDYYGIHPDYGTLADFKIFIREAHRRGLNVITELVLNHTSDQHVWFQQSRRAKPGSKWRDFYVWNDSPNKYKEARIIFKDYEPSNWTWDPVAEAFFWHRFYSHQPDLNYDNPAVKKAVFKVVDFWLELGVDGMRLDTIPYLFEREGTSCENLPETHAFVKELRAHIDSKFDHRMLLAEANQWPSDSVAYFGQGDECHMAFHFPIMPRLFMSIQSEDRFPLIDILEQTPPIPDIAQWALFLRNHDELTLEMVTDEERDYMYRVYAQDPQARLNLGIRRRLAPLLGNDRRKIELMNGILFSFPGTPIIYYGDEIGMGDNIYLGDRDGVRTPMQWSPDRNAGFSTSNSQRLCFPVTMDPEYHYETVNVDTQLKNPNSLLWWTKRLIALRKRFKAFGRGTIQFLDPKNTKVMAFIRSEGEEQILVVANFSRFVQYVELDLKAFNGYTPYELFGQTQFPAIGDLPYLLTLGPYGFYWFGLQAEKNLSTVFKIPSEPLSTLIVPENWKQVFQPALKSLLEKNLLRYLKKTPWYIKKWQPFKNASIEDRIPIPFKQTTAYLLILKVEYDKGDFERFVIPLSFAAGAQADQIKETNPSSILANIAVRESKKTVPGIFYDAFYDSEFLRSLFKAMVGNKSFRGESGKVFGDVNEALINESITDDLPVEVRYLDRSVIVASFDKKWFLKFYRHLEKGINPEFEVGNFLTAHTRLDRIPKTVGALNYAQTRESFTLGMLQTYVPHQANGWQYTVEEIDRYFERTLTHQMPVNHSKMGVCALVDQLDDEMPFEATERVGGFLEKARLIGKVTGELHLDLASHPDNQDFSPEMTSIFDQRSSYQSKCSWTKYAFRLLKRSLNELPVHYQELALNIVGMENTIIKLFQMLFQMKNPPTRIRYHGDYHLGQLLFTGKEFIIVDFEQNAEKLFSERRKKRSPLIDVVTMLHSFHAAVEVSLSLQEERGLILPNSKKAAEQSLLIWEHWTMLAFMKSYFETVKGASFIPSNRQDLKTMINAYLVQKLVHDIVYALQNNKMDTLLLTLKWFEKIGKELE